MEPSVGSRRDPIVITGCGWVTPFGSGSIADVLRAAGDSAGAARRSAPPYRAVADAVLAQRPGLPAEVRKDKGAWMTAAAIRSAMEDAVLAPQDDAPGLGSSTESPLKPDRVGLVLGCALAGQLGMIRFASEVRDQTPRFVSPINFPQTVGNYIAGAMARTFGFRGPNVTLAGETAGLDAIHEASAILDKDQAHIVVAGATEELTDEFAAALGQSDSSFSEAACWFVLERERAAAARQARPLARIQGLTRFDGDDSSGAQAGERIVSSFGIARPGAIFAEHWLGRSLAVSAPSALAAAIGAANGHDVPIADEDDPSVVHIRAVPQARLATIVGPSEGRACDVQLNLPAQTDGTDHRA